MYLFPYRVVATAPGVSISTERQTESRNFARIIIPILSAVRCDRMRAKRQVTRSTGPSNGLRSV